MSIDGIGAAGPDLGNGLKRTGQDADTRLRKAATQFEAVFIQQMLTAMRDSVPEGGLIDGGQAEDLFSSMLDGHLSELMAGRTGSGLGDAIYRQLSRSLNG